MKGKGKTFWALLLALSLLLGFAPGVVAQENELTVGESGSIQARGTPDDTPPEIVSYSIDKTQVDPGGTITVKIEITDDISGIKGWQFNFTNRKNGRRYSTHYQSGEEKEAVIEISQYEPDGIFELNEVYVEDKAENGQWYYSKNYKYRPENAKLLPQELSFTVKESTPDSRPPEFVSVYIDKTIIEAPGTIRIRPEITDDISGVSGWQLNFTNQKNGRRYSTHYQSGEEKEAVIEISQYEPDGIFELNEVYVEDKAENGQWYYSKNYKYRPENAKLLPQELYFTVQNDPNHLVSGTQSPTLAEDIKNLPEGTGASVSYESNPHISADVFEAIAGQDKTLTLEGDGIQWEFNGRDIENPKALDLKVDINPLWRTGSPNADTLQQQLRGQQVYVLSFPDNGKLPGKAKIRIKADYAFRQYLGSENLYVYYYDNTAQTYIPVAANVNVTDDGWLEFTTDHNSDFIITKGEVEIKQEEQKPPVDDKPDKPAPDSKPDRPSPDDRPNPGPGPNPGEGSAAVSSSGSENKSERSVWEALREEINAARAGETLRFTLQADERVPASLLRALKAKGEVTLVLRAGNSRSVTLTGNELGSISRAQYRFDELEQLAEKARERGEAASDRQEKLNPGTGAPEKTGAPLAPSIS